MATLGLLGFVVMGLWRYSTGEFPAVEIAGASAVLLVLVVAHARPV